MSVNLQYDSAMMAKLQESAEWVVYTKYLDNLKNGALAQLMNPSCNDQMTHHFRGVYTACVDMARLPDDVIQHEKDVRLNAKA